MEFKSPNYVPGVTGWMINDEGYAEFQDGIFRGDIIAMKDGVIRAKLTEDSLYFYDENEVQKTRIYGVADAFGYPGTVVETDYLMVYADQPQLLLANDIGLTGFVFDDVGNFYINSSITTEKIYIYGHLLPIPEAYFNLGSSVFYWNVVNYKTLTDRGCIINIDKKEAINDLRNISKAEKFIQSEQSKRLKTNPKYSRLDYSSFADYIRMPAEEEEIPIIDKETKKKIGTKKVMGEEGVDVGSIISMLLASVQDIDERLQKLEK